MDERRRTAFRVALYHGRALRDKPRFDALKDSCAGADVFVVGNGPSLRKQSPAIVRGKPVIACNMAALWSGTEPSQTVALCVDEQAIVRRESYLGGLARHEWLASLGCPVVVSTHVLTREWWSAVYSHPEFIVMDGRFGECGNRVLARTWDVMEPTCAGWTVAVPGIGLAAYMGAARIILLGVDMDYSGAETHFMPCGSGVNPKWDYAVHTKPVLEKIRDGLAVRGVQLLNGTLGGKVDCLERIRL